jgi:hypothetical protein
MSVSPPKEEHSDASVRKRTLRRAAITMTGGYSRYNVLPESELVQVPAGLAAAEAVSLLLSYTTAYQLIHRIAKRRQNESVLMHGTAGGVGTVALQPGARAGLEMFGTSSSKHGLVAALGECRWRGCGARSDWRTQLAAFVSSPRPGRPFCRVGNVLHHRRPTPETSSPSDCPCETQRRTRIVGRSSFSGKIVPKCQD